MRMPSSLICLLVITICIDTRGATTINPVNKFGYGANIGWMDWRGDTANGAVIGEFVCSGFIYAANVGWINLGSGAPTNMVRYRNLSANDFGVNHDGAGNLTGFAYGANIGWINFTNRDASGALFSGPKVDLVTGRLSGFVWSANCGWISLSNVFAFAQTDSIRTGSDTDNDGLPDDWEKFYAGDLTKLTCNADNDDDGMSSSQEYLADTDPLDAGSLLRITKFSAAAMGTSDTITWTSRPTRQYHLQKRMDLNPGFLWINVSISGSDLIAPDAGMTTTRAFSDTPSPRRFFRVEAFKPLSP